jgi:DNA-binding response OmpR family regulator/putative methionine-R-sulfoxide reductase with GAF domain
MHPTKTPHNEAHRLLLPCARGRIDLARHECRADDGGIQRLSTRETALLRYMAQHPNQDLSRYELLEAAWGASATTTRVVDMTIARLRKKLEASADAPEQLLTAYGHGYRFVPWCPGADQVEPSAAPREVLLLSDRRVDLTSATVVTDEDQEIRLTRLEVALLRCLARCVDEYVDAIQVQRELSRDLGTAGGSPRNSIQRLRNKLERDAKRPQHLLSARGLGYSLTGVRRAQAESSHDFTYRQQLWDIANHVGGVLRHEDCVMYARRGDKLVQVAAFGEKSPKQGVITEEIELQVGSGIVGEAVAKGRPELVPDTKRDPRYIFDVYPGQSELCVPVIRDGKVVGAIDSESRHSKAYSGRDVEAFASLARIAAMATSELSRVTV